MDCSKFVLGILTDMSDSTCPNTKILPKTRKAHTLSSLCLLSQCQYNSPHSVQFSSVASDSLRPHESQHARPPCPSPTPGVHSNSRPSSPWCHPAISSSVVPFSSCPQSLPASKSTHYEINCNFWKHSSHKEVHTYTDFLKHIVSMFENIFSWQNP